VSNPGPLKSKSFFPSSTPTYIPATDQIFGANRKGNPAGNSPEGPEAEMGESAFNVSRILGAARRKIWMLAICAVLFSLYSGYKESQTVSRYESNFRILVEPIADQQNLDRLTDETATQAKELDYFTLIEVLYSPKLLKPIFEEIALQFPEVTYDSEVSKLKVYRLGETTIIEVGYADISGEKVKLVLNKIAQGYLEYSIDGQQAQLKQSLRFIEEQLPKVRGQVDYFQQEIQVLRQTHNFIEPNSYAINLAQQITDLRAAQQSIQVELAALQLQYAQLQESAGATSILSNAEKYQQLLAEFQVLERDIALESARFGPAHPTIRLLQRQQENLLPILLKEAERALGEQVAQVANQILILQARYQSLSTAQAQLDDIYRSMPAILQQYDQLQRELIVATDNLTRFLETQEVLKIQASQKEIPWQLIAEPKEPWRQPGGNPLKAMIMGAVMGVLIGAVIAYVLEKFEYTFHTLEEVKKEQELTILGAIPWYPELRLAAPTANVVDLRSKLETQDLSIALNVDALKQDLKQLLNQPTGDIMGHDNSLIDKLNQVHDQQQQNERYWNQEINIPVTHHGDNWLEEYNAYGFMEAYRALYLNINRQGILDTLTSFVITSALPQEGRTTIAIHLAQAAAAMGRRVIIVDSHLRQGSQQLHHLLGLANEQGLSEYLQNKATLIQITQRLAWEKSLFAIAAGKPPPDPTRLLSSQTMYELTLRLRKNFDLVIYDMPPMMGLADVGLLTAKVDGTILVTSLCTRGSAPALQKTVERLKVVQANIIGLVVNKVKNYKVDLYA
jgi:succinoglycan biosynthesis transport protein ExoP